MTTSWTVNTCVSIVAAVADALHVAHSQGIIHLDVKSSNIFIDAGGQPHVGDFGIAISPDTDSDETTGPPLHAGLRRSRAGALRPAAAGTGHRCVWAGRGARTRCSPAGCRFGSRACSRFPATAITSCRRPVRSIVDVPLHLDQVCLRALAMQPEDRFASADEFAQTLRECLGHRPTGITASQPTVEHRRGPGGFMD